MKNIMTIIKKELTRFFTDKRMLLSLILPGIIIYVLYSIMGSFLDTAFDADTEHEYIVYTLNEPEFAASFKTTEAYNITIRNAKDYSITDIRTEIEAGNADLLITYEEDFEAKITSYNSLTDGKAPDVSMYYNSVDTESYEIYNYYLNALNGYESALNNKFDINYFADETFDLASDEAKSAEFITMMLPFLLIIFLFSGCLSIATESIAGEKERGTIATLLITPIKRSELALGKIISLSITSIASALVSFIALMMSLPNLFAGQDVSMSIYGVDTYLAIFAVIFTTVLVFTVLLSLVSTLSKSIKEATSYSMPVMVIVMLIGVTSMMGSGDVSTPLYLIPIYNSVQCMSSIFAFEFEPISFILTIISNIVFVGLGVFALTRAFNNEKIMFNK